MPKKNTAGYGLTGLAALLLIFFAMPWLSFSCMGKELISQNGYQVIVGSASSKVEEDGKKTDNMKDFNSEMEKEKDKDSMAAWWLLLAPLGALVCGLAGVLIARGSTGMVKPAVGASALAALTLTLIVVMGMPLERHVNKMKEDMNREAQKEKDNPFGGLGKTMGEMMSVERHYGPMLATGTAWLMLGLSIVIMRSSDRARATWEGGPPVF